MVGEKEIRGRLKEKKMGLTYNYVFVRLNPGDVRALLVGDL